MTTRSSEGLGATPIYGRYSHVKLKAHQANERTLIAWVFVGMLIMILSVPAAQFNHQIDTNPFLSTVMTIKPYQASSVLGLAALISGVVIAVMSCVRYVRARHNIEEGIYRGPDFFHLAFLGMILFASLFIGLFVMELRGAHWASRTDGSTAVQYTQATQVGGRVGTVPIGEV
ncbi:MAG TPA: DUF202 domain-containing protein [Chthonomonadaceae bacterium]|nr:DUF202 domain-containing protein [Chthonomonadaceae bacterium]